MIADSAFGGVRWTSELALQMEAFWQVLWHLPGQGRVNDTSPDKEKPRRYTKVTLARLVSGSVDGKTWIFKLRPFDAFFFGHELLNLIWLASMARSTRAMECWPHFHWTIADSNCTTQISWCWVFQIWIHFAMNMFSKFSEEMLNLIGMCLAKVNEKLIIATWMRTSDGDTCKSIQCCQESHSNHVFNMMSSYFVHDLLWLFDFQRGVKEESMHVRRA